MERSSKHKQTVFLLLYIFCVTFLIYLLLPFLTFVLLGATIVLALYPVNKRVRRYTGKIGGSVIMTLFVTLLILIPAVFAILGVVDEATSLQQLIQNTNLTAVEESITSYTGFELSLEEEFRRGISQVQSYAASQIPVLLGGITSAAVNIVILFFTIYYGFKEGDMMVETFFNMLPFGEEHRERLRQRSYSVFSGVLYGQLFVALIQGFFGGLSFFLFGVNGPIFWGVIMAFLSFIPLLGTPIIWLPASILLFAMNNVYAATGVFLFNTIITSNIDNIVKPKVIGDRTHMHPLLVVLSIFGGLSLFGIIGFILGPVLVSASYLVIQFYLEDLEQ